jgi:hypothetical protein
VSAKYSKTQIRRREILPDLGNKFVIIKEKEMGETCSMGWKIDAYTRFWSKYLRV